MKNNESFGQGVLFSLSSYVIWGFLTIYWKSIHGVTAFEILANRIIWSVVFVAILLKLTGKWPAFVLETRKIIADKRKALALVAAGFTILLNWGIFIWAVASGHIIETSMGYYINPLVSVLLGIFYLHEKLENSVKIAVLLAAIGVANMIWNIGVFPWISISLALSFGLYGLIKKTLVVQTMTSIILETLIVSPIAIAYLYYLADNGSSAWQNSSSITLLMLAGAGIVTATPLILFTAGAKLLPLSIVGFLQYVNPTITLLIGIFVYDENFTLNHLLSFGWIWLGLLVFSVTQFRHQRPKI